MRSLIRCFIILLIAIPVSAQQIDTTVPDLDRSHPGNLITINEDFPNSTIDGYNLYIPKSCIPDTYQYPVLVFLQGGKGVGGSVEKVLKWGLPNLIISSNSLDTEYDRLLRDTFVVVMPHISHGEFYEGEAAMRTILSRLIKNENVDPNRIYVTGLSRGGYGSWGLAERMSDVFAAAAPICGGGRGIRDYSKLDGLPIWVSHNTEDGIVPYRASSRVVERIEEVSKSKFYHSSSISSTDYETNDRILTSTKSDSHDAWTEMYSNVIFFKWLLRFRK